MEFLWFGIAVLVVLLVAAGWIDLKARRGRAPHPRRGPAGQLSTRAGRRRPSTTSAPTSQDLRRLPAIF